jgi:hypothetical protein
VRSLVSAAPRGRPLALPGSVSLGGLILAATLPIVFLHVDYQPSASLHLGGAHATFKLQDAFVLLTILAAATQARSRRLRSGLPVWTTQALLLLWIVAAVFYPLASSRAYAWKTHLVTAGEFGEYMLLAPAVPLLLRRRGDALLALGTLVVWAVVATGVGLVQWGGWSGLAGWGQGHRQPSFLGTHDFAALAGMTLGIGLVALLWRVHDPRLRTGAWVAVVTGVVGFVLGGATAGVIGLVPAALVAVALRAGDFGQFFRFLGVEQTQSSSNAHIQTYSQRTVLAYIGARIWLHHPIVGVGWEGSNDPSAFARELPAAHKRFPHVAAIAFPSAQHRYGVQILYVQALADLGVVGFLLVVAVFAAGILVAVRSALRAPPRVAFAATLGLFWILLSLGLWSAVGLVAGIPLDALTWLAFGAVCIPAVAD